jgi:hypothetical protein
VACVTLIQPLTGSPGALTGFCVGLLTMGDQQHLGIAPDPGPRFAARTNE